jgi:hypothetical protein
MSVRLSVTENVKKMPTPVILLEINNLLKKIKNKKRFLTIPEQKYIFSRAIVLYHRENANNNKKNLALNVLRGLAQGYNRNWNNLPRPNHLFNRTNSNRSNSN